MIRLPRYLDEDLLRTLADYLNLEDAEQREIRRRTTSSRAGGASVNLPIAQGSLDRATDEEREEHYSAPVRPTRLLNDVLDGLTQSGELLLLDHDPTAQLLHRSALEASGTLKLSPVSEIATIFQMFLPLLQAGADLEAIPPDQLGSMLLERRSVEAPVVAEFTPSAGAYTFVTVLRPAGLLGSGGFDELEGEYTVFGILDRVLGSDDHLSLEQYMLPGLNRVLRRALGGEQISELLATIGTATNRTFDQSDLQFSGPGALLSAIAIYP